MQFQLIDRILEVEPGKRIVAIKELRPEEAYLKDHFPHFPVMPGVLMLEAMFQASMWLVRKTEGFQTAIVVLREARNIKYADFVRPGQTLRLTAEIIKQDSRTTTLKAEGSVNSTLAVGGRLVLERFNQADLRPSKQVTDALTSVMMREEYDRLMAVTA